MSRTDERTKAPPPEKVERNSANRDSLGSLGSIVSRQSKRKGPESFEVQSQSLTVAIAASNGASEKEKKSKAQSNQMDTLQADGTPGDSENGGVSRAAQSPVTSSKGKKSSIGNKTYVQLIHEAIEALNDRTGSSMPAIKKWLLQEHEHLEDSKQFRYRLNHGIKTAVSQGRFEKIRCSFKISSSWKAAQREKKKKSQQSASGKAKANATNNESTTVDPPSPQTYKELVKHNKAKLQKLEASLSVEEIQKLKAQMRKKEIALHKKEEAERKERERQERIKKRRFPMEDTKLHLEDKELGVKPPPCVKPRPSLPHFWQIVVPLGENGQRGRPSDQALRNGKVDSLDQGSRGLVPDLLQVYHFFRGDVHFMGDTAAMQEVSTTKRKKKGGVDGQDQTSPLVPDFSLSHLIYATDEILNGNARRSRLVPPLISHLFVTCLQLLCRPPDNAPADADPQRHLQYELNKYLLPALTPGSWPDICHLYIDSMERFYSTDSSRDRSVLLPLNTDLEYLFGRVSEPTIPMTPGLPANEGGGGSGINDAGQSLLPNGYLRYLGHSGGALHRAHEKLGRSEAWMLTAEEIMALLRALTDDVLGTYPGISENLARREEEMQELLKAKKAADSKLRKVRLAFEGPRKAKKPQDGASGDVQDLSEEADGTSETFTPSVSQKEFDAAARAQQKANDAYEKGIRQLVARTEPIGYDRNHNAIYCFRHNPECLYVEELRPPSNPSEHTLPEEFQFHRRSWHFIDCTSLFDAYTSSLDVRGKREQDLYEAMRGSAGAQQSLRRYLHDDLKAKADVNSRRRERDLLEKRLEAAKVKCDEEKRRSDRLADQAEEELARAQKELDDYHDSTQQTPSNNVSYEKLTGLALLRSYDAGPDRRETRRSREKKEVTLRPLSHIPCSTLVPSGNIDGTGIVGLIVSQLLSLEESCESVSRWEPGLRKTWISKVENAVHAWYTATPFHLGPPPPELPNPDTPLSQPAGNHGKPSTKKRRTTYPPDNSNSSPGIQSMSSVISSLRKPLLDLESRVADITNLALVARDAEIADDNMSTDESRRDSEKKELDLAWKKEIHKLRQASSRQHPKVREFLVKAISLARKAHASDVVAELRAALLLFHPNSASDSRKEAIRVLEAHGDFTGPMFEEDAGDDNGDEKPEREEFVSVLSAEAALLTGCLGINDESTRKDWIELVTSCRTLSRLSSLTAAFRSVVEQKLARIAEERDDLNAALATWQKDAAKTRGGKKNTTDSVVISEVWANVILTDEICMAKVEEWPWWPSKICEAKDESLNKTLKDLNKVLVSLMGEMGALRIVAADMIRPFTGEAIVDEGVEEVQKKTLTQLDECLAMARRIQRGAAKSKFTKVDKSKVVH